IGAYLEGDVRVTRTPKDQQKQGEQRLMANRAYYDFTTDRAVLTDVIMHTTDPKSAVPMVVRARMMRQLSSTPEIHEYEAEGGAITTSTFHTPSYSIGAKSTYIRQTGFTDDVRGVQTSFVAHDATFKIAGTPVFYLPVMAGTVVENEPLRHAEMSN